MHGHSFIEQISAAPDEQSARIRGMVVTSVLVQVNLSVQKIPERQGVAGSDKLRVGLKAQQELSKQNPKERLMLRTCLNL